MREAYIILNEDKTFISAWYIEGSQPEGAIKYTYSGNFVKPKFDVVTMQAYEGATPQEIETYNDQFYPNEISRRQLKLQWQLDGRELSEIDDTINNMPDTTEKQRLSKITAKNAWQESIVFERKDILIQNLGLTLFNNNQELNNFFLRASQK